MSFQGVQLVTIALTLFAPSYFMHYVQCSQMNVDVLGMEMTAQKLQRQARQNEMPEPPTDEDITYCESIEREAYCSSGVAQSIINANCEDILSNSLQSPACEDELRLKAPATEPKCSVRIAQDLLCSNIGQAYINGLLEDSRCSQINLNMAKEFVRLCSVRADGALCSQDDFDIFPICNMEINNTSAVCTPMCRDTLEEVRSTEGCCINIFNHSDSAETETPPALDYRLWESCRVETPGFCESKLTLDVTISTTAAVRNTNGANTNGVNTNGAISIYLKYSYRHHTFLYSTQFIVVLITALVMILIHM
jgi:hypothetical protein